MGRIVTHINAMGLSTKTCYGFGPARSSIEESRALGYLQLTILDVMGHEIKVVDNEDPTQPLSAEANRVLETKEYDCLSRMVQSTDILMLTTNYTYDALSRLINVIDPKGNITSYQSIRGCRSQPASVAKYPDSDDSFIDYIMLEEYTYNHVKLLCQTSSYQRTQCRRR
ncbi:hypothetical protein BKA59DRAFT_512757 [Fusarium tricinctum]|uniref:Uncharacterized protein n=1 Tax=Fusarium tricinctum TaxID=61284 RepID=A0A8K0RSS1_9HYPO|nr:hypothetical protein BKA59DRAFT_512757 [Fusarium tricinctum]